MDTPLRIARCISAILLLGTAALGGCATNAHVEALAARTEALEARVSALEADLVRVEGRTRTGIVEVGPHGYGFRTNTKTVTIAFDPPFARPPRLFVTPMDAAGNGHPDNYSVTLQSVDRDSAVVKVQRTDKAPDENWWAQALQLHWLAYAPDADWSAF